MNCVSWNPILQKSLFFEEYTSVIRIETDTAYLYILLFSLESRKILMIYLKNKDV